MAVQIYQAPKDRASTIYMHSSSHLFNPEFRIQPCHQVLKSTDTCTSVWVGRDLSNHGDILLGVRTSDVGFAKEGER
jgi:hypothetical protein